MLDPKRDQLDEGDGLGVADALLPPNQDPNQEEDVGLGLGVVGVGAVGVKGRLLVSEVSHSAGLACAAGAAGAGSGASGASGASATSTASLGLLFW